MKRKVIQHGPSSLTVSLPSAWVKKNNIIKGSEVDVVEQDFNLLIGANHIETPSEVEVDFSGLDRTSILICLRGLYRRGYDTVKINFKNSTTTYRGQSSKINVLTVIHEEVNRLIGFEIMQEKENFCLIKDLQENSLKDFDQVLRRLFLLVTSTCDDFVLGVQNMDIPLIESIKEKHDTITKFVSYCLRLFNKHQFPDQKKSYYYYFIIATIDRIMDIFKYAARAILKYNKKLNPKVIKILSMVNTQLREYHSFFYKYSNDKIGDMNNRRYETEEILDNLPNKIDTMEVIIATNMFHIMEKLIDLTEARAALEY